MTQEEKELLKKVLCEMLPHGVICNCVDTNFSGSVDWTLYAINLQDDTIGATNGEWNDEFDIEEVKPYLRPISSMTKEEMEELRELCGGIVWTKDILHDEVLNIYYRHDALDWLLKHHFDTRGLIEMGLALEAPEGMYKAEQI